MSKWLIEFIQNIEPHTRLIFAGRLFWFSIVGAVLSGPIAYFAQGWFGVILMTISWLAVTFTCWDIIQTADVREAEENGKSEK